MSNIDRDKIHPDILEIEAALIKLLSQYKQLSVAIVIQDDTSNERMFAGTMCPVCAAEYMIAAIKDNDLKHTTDGYGSSIH